MALQPGEIIDGKYRIVKQIGEGGMGAVYLGENTRIKRKVAIKVLHAAVAEKKDVVARFEREAQAAGRIGSEHIVEVLDLGSLPSNERFMVMEFLDGEDLTQRIKKCKRLTPQQCVPLLEQVLDGLGAAHDAQIIHRDLKPDNIYILHSKAGRPDFVKLLDFGVSKFSALDSEMSMTRTGAVMGTPYYMSPEQAKGGTVDNRSDLYAIGVVLYQMVTGRVPFNASSFNELLFKIALESPDPIEKIVPDCPPSFVAIVNKAMAREPEARFQSSAEFKLAVQQWLHVNSPGAAHHAGYAGASGGYPAAGASGGYLAAGASGGYPAAGASGGYPAAGASGGYPAARASAPGGYPPAPHPSSPGAPGGYPAAPGPPPTAPIPTMPDMRAPLGSSPQLAQSNPHLAGQLGQSYPQITGQLAQSDPHLQHNQTPHNQLPHNQLPHNATQHMAPGALPPGALGTSQAALAVTPSPKTKGKGTMVMALAFIAVAIIGAGGVGAYILSSPPSGAAGDESTSPAETTAEPPESPSTTPEASATQAPDPDPDPEPSVSATASSEATAAPAPEPVPEPRATRPPPRPSPTPHTRPNPIPTPRPPPTPPPAPTRPGPKPGRTVPTAL